MSYIQDVAALIKISEFLSVCAEKDSLDKTKAYKAARLRSVVDNKIVDLVADDKFMSFVEEVKDQKTMAQAEADLKMLIDQHDEETKDILSTRMLGYPSAKADAGDTSTAVDSVEVKEDNPGKIVPETKKKKSPGFRKVS